MRRQAWLIAAVMFAIACADQATKAWAWRNTTSARIDSGGGLLLTDGVGSLFSDPLAGAACDLLGAAVLAGAVLALARHYRSTSLLVSASVALGGWTSNLADRLGMHYWTAPESRRGVVDFIDLAGRTWNLADLSILTGSCATVVAAVRLIARQRSLTRARVVRSASAHRRAALACGAGLVVAAALAAVGAIRYGGFATSASYLASSSS